MTVKSMTPETILAEVTITRDLLCERAAYLRRRGDTAQERQLAILYEARVEALDDVIGNLRLAFVERRRDPEGEDA